jgi:DNA-binding NarL/FixJ family response regulator/predicted  nucleic acid-binding Zn-ribbon protein
MTIGPVSQMSQSLRILLIAEDPEVIRRIGQGLQRQDSGLILIEGADSLATARRRLGSGTYDLALVDLALGRGDGLRLLSELLEMAPELPVVALAADPAAPDAAACLAIGAQDRLALEAMDAAGLVDRLHCAAARGRTELSSRRRSQRIAASLAATGDIAWHYEAGDEDAWLAAADPAAWRLPGPECRETLDALRARVHPDDRELTLKRIGELVQTEQPWQLDARLRIGGYRWCTLRGRSHRNAQGRLERVCGVLSDAQRQQKALRELEQGRRFLRAVVDSDRVPQAVLDSAAMITDCNQAWLSLDHAPCHAGSAFRPGTSFIDHAAGNGQFGDLDTKELVRGVRQVLGGVVEQFECEYGNGTRRWQIHVGPLLNPGIAGAVIRHEEITAIRRAEIETQSRLAAIESDFRALSGPQLRIDAEFRVQAANADARSIGRAPVIGRDVLKVLPRIHADAVGAALAAISGGAGAAVRDSRPANGQVLRWLLAARYDAAGNSDGFLVHGIDVSDLAQQAETLPAVETRQAEIQALRSELEEERRLLAAARQALLAEKEEAGDLAARLAEHEQRATGLVDALATAEAHLEELQAELEQQRREIAAARRKASEAEQAGGRLAEALDAERARCSATMAALAAAEQVPVALRAALGQARQGLRSELDELMNRIFNPLLDEPDRAPRRGAHDKKAG